MSPLVNNSLGCFNFVFFLCSFYFFTVQNRNITHWFTHSVETVTFQQEQMSPGGYWFLVSVSTTTLSSWWSSGGGQSHCPSAPGFQLPSSLLLLVLPPPSSCELLASYFFHPGPELQHRPCSFGWEMSAADLHREWPGLTSLVLALKHKGLVSLSASFLLQHW